MKSQFKPKGFITDAEDVPTEQLNAVHISDEDTHFARAVDVTTPPLLPVVEQVTLHLPTHETVVGAASPKNDGHRSLFASLFTRLQTPGPEDLLTSEVVSIRSVHHLGAFPALMLSNACGLFTISLAYFVSVAGYGDTALEVLFLLGLLIMFVPNLVRLLSLAPEKLERVCALCGLGICFYLVEFMTSPLHFASFDDFLHWRTADDILRSGHLFSLNSMLPVSPYYPGLEIVTNAVSTMTGLSTFYAGVVVILVARFLMVLSLFLLFERILKSNRMAGLATLIYMANPHFLFFDASYSYETLALPFATFTLYILARYEVSNKDHRFVLVIGWLMLIAVTITHHMTDYTLVGLLVLWAGISFLRPVARGTRLYLLALALFGISLALVYAFLLPGNPVWSYLSRYFAGALSELELIVSGSGGARSLFVSAAQPSPPWDRVLITGAVVLITLSLPIGLFSLWQQYRRNLLVITLSVFSLIYPISQLFRLTQYGSEITDRAAAFLFLSIACLFTVLIAQFLPTWRRNRRVVALITVTLSVILLGSVLVEIGAEYGDLPGPYLVSADMRSVEPEGIEAATWSRIYLGPNNRMGADRINQMLMSTYGDQRVVTRLSDNVDIAPIFYASQLSPDEVSLLRYAGLNYLVVDQRLSQSLPLVGLYFENDMPTKTISRQSLTKFNTVPQLDRIFDSGNIAIYDAGAYFNGSS